MEISQNHHNLDSCQWNRSHELSRYCVFLCPGWIGVRVQQHDVGTGSVLLHVLCQYLLLLNLAYIVTNVPRRTGISLFYALTMCVGLLYFTSFVQNNMLVSTLLIGISRVFSGIFDVNKVSANCLIGCMETEAFKSEIQSSAIGLIEGLGLYGAIIAPFIVQVA